MDSIIRTFKNAKRHYEDTRIITDTFKSRHSLEKRIEEKQGYSMDLKERKMTKKAAKRFFKENKNEITFEDYKIAREFKRVQNKREVKDFMKDD